MTEEPAKPARHHVGPIGPDATDAGLHELGERLFDEITEPRGGTMRNWTPLGKPLELPDDPPLRVNAMFDSDAPCLEHAVSYTGSIPCTGVLRCSLCLSRWDESGKYLGRG